jgi:uncharacterized protein YqeY
VDLKQRLVEEMKDGMKSGDTNRVGVVRMLRSTIKNKEIERGKDTSLTEAEVLQVVTAAIKQRKESIPLFEKADRADLVEKEKKEVVFLESLLPQSLSEDELNATISKTILEVGATSIKQMGDVMKVLLPLIVGRADGKEVSDKVRACLTNPQ